MALSTENGTPNYHQHCIYCDHIIFRWFITPIYQCLWHHIPVIFPRQTFSENAPKMSQNVMKIKCQSWSTSSFRCIIHILRLWQQINRVLSTNYMHHERRWKQPETYWYSSYYIWQDYVQLRKKMSKFRLLLRQTHWAPKKITWLVVLTHSKNMLIISNNHPFVWLNITKYFGTTNHPTQTPQRRDVGWHPVVDIIVIVPKYAMLEYAMVSVDKHYWLVVYLPLWKIWVRQLGLWPSQYMEKMFQNTNQTIIHQLENDAHLGIVSPTFTIIRVTCRFRSWSTLSKWQWNVAMKITHLHMIFPYDQFLFCSRISQPSLSEDTWG